MMHFINLNTTYKEKLVIDKAGDYVVFFHNLSGRFVFELEESHINLEIYGLFTGHKKDIFRLETIQNHKAPSSTSNLLIKGVFDEESKFYYQGLIRLEKEAQKSHAYQKNQNIILSPHVFVESKPFLEILANDVFCTHGSTTGKLNKDELFYLVSRGLDEKSSRTLLVNGFVNEVIDKVKKKVPDFTYAEN